MGYGGGDVLHNLKAGRCDRIEAMTLRAQAPYDQQGWSILVCNEWRNASRWTNLLHFVNGSLQIKI